MIGAIILSQVVAVAAQASDAPRRPVSSGPVDLSTFAAGIHINRKAFDGWVPRKGEPAPPAESPQVVFLPTPQESGRSAPRRAAEERASAEPGDTVNAFGEPRPMFFGSPLRPPRFAFGRPHHRPPAARGRRGWR